MLKGETITSIQEFVQTNYEITDVNHYVFTYYVIQYDGTNECKQDISRFIGGFGYGDLTLVNTALMSQHIANKTNRSLKDCIESISIGDYICLSCHKFFVIPKDEFQTGMRKKIKFNLERFKKYYGQPEETLGINLYGKSYRTEAILV